jgi:hypothetical protein
MSQEVSNGRTSTSVVYGRLQAASSRSGRIKWPLDRIGGQGTWPARFRIAAVGGATWGRAGADGGGAAPHNKAVPKELEECARIDGASRWQAMLYIVIPAAARRPTTQATLPSADHAAEIARLQRENERLRMEREILKKSIAIFAGVQK